MNDPSHVRHDTSWPARLLRLVALAAFAVAVPLVAAQLSAQTAKPAAVPLPYKSTDMSMGVVNCANSLCHGSVKPIKDSNVLQTEYVTWSRVDKHARAYTVLFDQRSLTIEKNFKGLSGGKDRHPEEDALCLNCHVSPRFGTTPRHERFSLIDGVGCEACHGAAENWLRGTNKKKVRLEALG